MLDTYTSYQEKYFHKCISLLQKNWPNTHPLVTEFMFLSYLKKSNYCILVFDKDKKKLKGLILANIHNQTSFFIKLSYVFHYFILIIKYILKISLSTLKIKTALLRELFDEIDTQISGLKGHNHFDSTIYLLASTPEFHKKGIGLHLIKQFQKICINNNIHSIFLWSDLESNYHFYEKNGFILFNTITHHSISLPNVNHHIFQYILYLKQSYLFHKKKSLI